MTACVDSAQLARLVADLVEADELFRASLRKTTQHAIRAGLDLMRIKEILGYGSWLKWLREDCPIKERNAQRFMRIARYQQKLPSRELTVDQALALLANPKPDPTDSSDLPEQFELTAERLIPQEPEPQAEYFVLFAACYLGDWAKQIEALPAPAVQAVRADLAALQAAIARVLVEVTVNAHAAVIQSKGFAVLGKMGQRIGPVFQEALNRQIQQGVRTYLFLTLREGWNGEYVTYRCPLRQVHEHLEPEKRPFVPTYYLNEASNIKTWFEITGIDRLSREEMNRILVLSSGRSIMSVVTSTAAVFRVGVRAK